MNLNKGLPTVIQTNLFTSTPLWKKIRDYHLNDEASPEISKPALGKEACKASWQKQKKEFTFLYCANSEYK